MESVNMQFSLDGFKKAVHDGMFHALGLSYGFIDEAKFAQSQMCLGWKVSQIQEIFGELKQRMSRKYYKDVVLAQAQALDYASLQFPAYSMLVAEDLAEDWLAIVDFHKKYSRDHSLHQPLTAYIAASLLGMGDANKSLAIPARSGNILNFCVDCIFTSEKAKYILESARSFGFPESILTDSKMSREFWRDLFYRTVILSALFHDIGYPWQYVDRIGSNLNKSVNILHPLDSTVQNIVEQFKDRMVFMPLRHYNKNHVNEPINEKIDLIKVTSSAMETHGFPGAIAFLSMNDAIRKYPTEQPTAMIQEFSIEWAAMGIFMHDMAGKHKKLFPKIRVNILQDPLSAIVSLSDYLEEFNRPKVSFQTKSRQCRIKYYSDCSLVEIVTDRFGTLKVRMKYESNSSKVIAASFKDRETMEYFDPGTGYVDLSAAGIRQVVYEQI